MGVFITGSTYLVHMIVHRFFFSGVSFEKVLFKNVVLFLVVMVINRCGIRFFISDIGNLVILVKLLKYGFW